MSGPTVTSSSAPAAPGAPEASTPTHGCVRCGVPVPLDVAMCDRCNPLGLSQPASSQAHGTVFLGVAVAVVGLALLGQFVLAGIGPFTTELRATVPDPRGLSVTIAVTNEGSRAGIATCRVYDPSLGIGPETAFFQSPRVEPGETLTFSRLVTELGTEPEGVAADCVEP
jgi:hypothetical protein